MRTYRLLVIDLDGTMYRGSEKIEEAPIFIKQIMEAQLDYIFLTNNSSKKPAYIVEHLRGFGIETDESKVYTSSMATAQYISEQRRGARVFAIGEEGILSALELAGSTLVSVQEDPSSCDFVVIGIDRQITYEKLAFAALAVRAGATFISTNADKALPTERGLLPGNGSLTSVISTSTGVQPTFIGKPEPLMLKMIMEQKGLNREDLLMIGDNYETDIMAGIQAGIDSALVLTGFTSRKELQNYKMQPTYIWDSLLQWQEIIRK